MALPAPVVELVREIAGAEPSQERAVHGGDINQAAVVEAGGLQLFLKWHRRAPAGFFEAEADGLARLAASTPALRVPEVLGLREKPELSVLAMAYVPPGRGSRHTMARAGRALATLHARRGLAPGLDRENFIGSLPQANGPASDGLWTTFFRERRLLALAEGLPGNVRRGLERLDVAALLTEPEGGCALLHGDLWSGNLHADAGGDPWFIDPAVYAGHPEVDLAMTRLFGGFDAAFYDAYQEVAGRFDSGIAQRLELLNLYPLLVHTHLFGGGYLARVEAIVSRYVG